MPRVKAILKSDFPYNISARCINREWFQLPMEQVWDIFCQELTNVHQEHQLLIHSFVLMSNHFHLIATTPEANISTCMQRFMHRSSRRLSMAGNRINETFAGRHYKCILQHQTYFMNAYKYNYRNPVSSNICKKVEDYPFSTLHMKLGKSLSKIPLIPDENLKLNTATTLDWLNKDPAPEKIDCFRFGIRHQFFISKKDRRNNRPILTENDLL